MWLALKIKITSTFTLYCDALLVYFIGPVVIMIGGYLEQSDDITKSFPSLGLVKGYIGLVKGYMLKGCIGLVKGCIGLVKGCIGLVKGYIRLVKG